MAVTYGKVNKFFVLKGVRSFVFGYMNGACYTLGARAFVLPLRGLWGMWGIESPVLEGGMEGQMTMY